MPCESFESGLFVTILAAQLPARTGDRSGGDRAMILSNIKMQEAMDLGRLVIDPKPLPLRPTGGQKCPYDTHAVNLTLGPELSIPQSGPYTFDLAMGGNLSSFLSKNSDH